MTIIVTDPPVGEALTLADVKDHLRLDGTGEDTYLQGLIRVAREHLEATTGLALLNTGLRLALDDWPADHRILLRRHPVRSIEAVTIFDEEGIPHAIASDGWVLDAASRPARLAVTAARPAGRCLNGIEIDFIAGFGESGADVPDTLKRAMLTHIAQMYDLRGAVSLDQQPGAVPPGYDRLLGAFARRAI